MAGRAPPRLSRDPLAGWLRPSWNSPLWAGLQLTIVSALLIWLTVRGAAGMRYSWQWYQVPQFLVREVDGELLAGPLLKGLAVTLEITFWSFVLAVLFGLVTALLRQSASIIGAALARVYLEVIRNTPLLVQLYVFYFILSPVLDLDRYLTGVLCLALFEGAYMSEIIRAGIVAVPRGQWEAAAALGLSRRHVYRKVVLPQAVRIVLPPMGNQTIALLKSSAMVSVVAVFDLTNEGRSIISDTFMTFEIWLTVAAIYLAMTIMLSGALSLLERLLRIA